MVLSTCRAPSPVPGATTWLWLAGERVQGTGTTREASLQDAMLKCRKRYDADPLMGPWELEAAEAELREGSALQLRLQGAPSDIQFVWNQLLHFAPQAI